MSSTAENTSHAVYAGKIIIQKYDFSVFAVYVFLIGAVSTQLNFVEQTVGYVLFIIGCVTLFSVYIANNETKLSGNYIIFLIILIISVIFSISTILSPSSSSIFRLILFTPILIFNLFFVSATISRGTFYSTLARVSSLVILIGFPALVVGSIGPIQIAGESNPPGSPIAVPVIKSVFTNQNAMAPLGVFGALAALWEYFSVRSRFPLVLFFINSVGVYLSQGRAATLALLTGLVIILIYYYTGRSALIAVTVAGVTITPTVLLIKFGVVPGPELIRDVDFSNRVALWTAAFQALLERPLVGWGVGNVPEAMSSHLTQSLSGAGPHTSYIRMFAATGIVGGLLYLYIYLKSMADRLFSISDNADATEYGMVLGVVVIHTFSGISLFGLALGSVIPTIILGYAQKAN